MMQGRSNTLDLTSTHSSVLNTPPHLTLCFATVKCITITGSRWGRLRRRTTQPCGWLYLKNLSLYPSIQDTRPLGLTGKPTRKNSRTSFLPTWMVHQSPILIQPLQVFTRTWKTPSKQQHQSSLQDLYRTRKEHTELKCCLL